MTMTSASPPTAPRLMSVDEARDRVLAAVARPLRAEAVSPVAAVSRVVAEAILAMTSLPPWDNAAMDGYAVRSADVSGASNERPVRLMVIGEVRAGSEPDVEVRSQCAVRIATGAPLPPGADAVVPVEDTTPLDPVGQPIGARGRDATGPLPASCLVHVAVAAGGSVRRAGSDLAGGATILDRGAVVTPSAVALIAGAGVRQVRVHRRPRVGVLATGDEVRAPGEPLGPAGIPDANRPGLLAHVAAAGGEPIDLGIAADRLDDVLARLRDGIARTDAIIVSGGVSVGPYDVVKAAFDAVGRIDLWRVAVQPGKPFAFGTADRPDAPQPILLFGLPGNPVSSIVTFELFVRPALRRLAGHPHPFRPLDRAVLTEAVSKSHRRRAFLRVVADRDHHGMARRDGRGRVYIRLAGGQGSHVLSALAVADALAVIPEATDELPAGTEVELWWLDTA
jgi:molybdopterin molybdotransferase